MSKIAEFDTIREAPDELWAEIKKVLEELDPPKKTGRPRVDGRLALNGIIYRLRSSCQWNHLPEKFGSDSSVHRTFQRWLENGVFERVWALLVERCDEIGAVQWKWQSADGSLGKARSRGGLTGPNPTDRGKSGTKRSILVDGDGGPLSVVVAGANVNDHKLLRATIESVVLERPSSPQNLCLDKGYDNGPGEIGVLINGYIPHIRRIGEEKLDGRGRKTRKARRWVVERTFAWLSKYRAILVRYEKKARKYLGLLQLACLLLWYRRYHRLTVLGLLLRPIPRQQPLCTS